MQEEGERLSPRRLMGGSTATYRDSESQSYRNWDDLLADASSGQTLELDFMLDGQRIRSHLFGVVNMNGVQDKADGQDGEQGEDEEKLIAGNGSMNGEQDGDDEQPIAEKCIVIIHGDGKDDTISDGNFDEIKPSHLMLTFIQNHGAGEVQVTVTQGPAAIAVICGEAEPATSGCKEARDRFLSFVSQKFKKSKDADATVRINGRNGFGGRIQTIQWTQEDKIDIMEKGARTEEIWFTGPKPEPKKVFLH